MARQAENRNSHNGGHTPPPSQPGQKRSASDALSHAGAADPARGSPLRGHGRHAQHAAHHGPVNGRGGGHAAGSSQEGRAAHQSGHLHAQHGQQHHPQRQQQAGVPPAQDIRRAGGETPENEPDHRRVRRRRAREEDDDSDDALRQESQRGGQAQPGAAGPSNPSGHGLAHPGAGPSNPSGHSVARGQGHVAEHQHAPGPAHVPGPAHAPGLAPAPGLAHARAADDGPGNAADEGRLIQGLKQRMLAHLYLHMYQVTPSQCIWEHACPGTTKLGTSRVGVRLLSSATYASLSIDAIPAFFPSQGEFGDNREGLGPGARNQALKRFYSHLSTYLDLIMWKVRGECPSISVCIVHAATTLC